MTLTRAEGWLVASVSDEILMLNIERGEYVGLNETGAVIWELLETPQTIEQLVASLLTRFEVDAVQATAEVNAFIEQAMQKGMVQQR
ncbi:PqqD family protein [Sphingomonas sp.]|jgi:hypothetical protein|uniref:PqqD family protein n=1 Tax=Sphingomonas sp. TaxID=28214 RepID=UPI003BAB777C